MFDKLKFTSIASAFLLGAVLLITTACSNGNELGARTENPTVQVGGQNNPHKAGGDGMTQYKATDDPRVTEGLDNASLPASTTVLAAANRSQTTYPTDDNQIEGILYSDSDRVESLSSVDDFVSPQTQKQLLDPTQIPAKKQPIIDRSDPDARILEKAVKAFDEAGNFSAN